MLGGLIMVPDAPALAADPDDPAAELASFQVADGFEVNLFASEKDGVVKPIQIRFDARGRLWVIGSTVYRPEDFVALYADLVGHWDKRNRHAIESTNPGKLDRAALLEFAQTYGRDAVVEAVRRGDGLEGDSNSKLTGGIEDLDDYFRCKIERREDLRDLFVPRFYFGCEADDPINAWAFNRRANPMGARLNALFSSDIGHFDVPDMAEVVPEAYELVEHGLITDDDFRDFMFTNAVRFWGEVNPDFFKGTVVEKAATDVLA